MAKNDLFLYCYFYHLESILKKDKKKLSDIKFQSEEANTDEYIKKYLKEVIQNNNRLSEGEIETITIIIDNEKNSYPFSSISDVYIKKVYLPEELSPKMKEEIAKSKSSVYTRPDLYILVSDDVEESYYPVEIKTTKNNNIPGSSVQQVSPFEWTIFVKHNDNDIDVSCGFYLNAMTDKLPFPDRSPRPQVGFDTIKQWNEKNRKLEGKELSYTSTQKDIDFKKKCLTDWEDILCDEWMETIQKDKSEREKWFNNTIRKFSLRLIDYINNTKDIEELINKLQKNIKKNGEN